ncbi:MAG: pyridoxal-phosphate dependent enzyme [bacterium]|nr:pyridoxal-phosphate dependent enzyme [bacterium]
MIRPLALAVEAAAERIAPHVYRTPTVASPWLSEACGAEVRLKLENAQRTGSFKIRGATNALLVLDESQRRRGVIAASSGNHGLGVATAANELGIAATVYVPTTTPAAKRSAIERAGAEVVVFGPDCVDTEREARRAALESERHYLSPYNDLDVLEGQGSIAVELVEQWPEVERVYVAVGGGGLIGGMAAWAHDRRGDLEFVGCSPVNSPAMAECVRAGRIIDVRCAPTLSDSTAGGVEADAVTFPLCRDFVHRYLEVNEDPIADAVRGALEHQHQLLEGAAGVAIAACLADCRVPRRPSAVIACGGNLPLATLRQLLAN